MLKVTVFFFLIFILSVSAEDVDRSLYYRRMRLIYLSFQPEIPPSLLCFSEEAWEGLEKPVGTLTGHTFLQCWQKCSELGGNCALIRSNPGLQTCTPAKVWIILQDQSVCFYFLRLTLTVSPTILRSAARPRQMVRLHVLERSRFLYLIRWSLVYQVISI